MTLNIRNAQLGDEQNIIDFYNYIGGETDFLSFGENEYPRTVSQQIDYINNILKSTTDIMLLALEDSKIVGIITLDSSPKRKFAHVEIGRAHV